MPCNWMWSLLFNGVSQLDDVFIHRDLYCGEDNLKKLMSGTRWQIGSDLHVMQAKKYGGLYPKETETESLQEAMKEVMGWLKSAGNRKTTQLEGRGCTSSSCRGSMKTIQTMLVERDRQFHRTSPQFT